LTYMPEFSIEKLFCFNQTANCNATKNQSPLSSKAKTFRSEGKNLRSYFYLLFLSKNFFKW